MDQGIQGIFKIIPNPFKETEPDDGTEGEGADQGSESIMGIGVRVCQAGMEKERYREGIDQEGDGEA